MPRLTRRDFIRAIVCTVLFPTARVVAAEPAGRRRLTYVVSDLRIPFWNIVWRGIQGYASASGYRANVLSAGNSAKAEIANMVEALDSKPDGIILSPTTSSAATVLLKLAKDASVPVVVADIGADSGDYVTYISSDNRDGAYRIGRILATKLKTLGWADGRVGIVAIPQKRANGQARTAGFMEAMEEAKIKGAGIRQQVDFSYQETFDHTRALLTHSPDIRAIWLQGSDRYQGALDAIAAAGRTGQVLLLTFDAEPEFLDLIPKGVIAVAGMQQPFLIGEKAAEAMDRHLKGEAVEREQRLPVLAVSDDNIQAALATIRRNVLGIR